MNATDKQKEQFLIMCQELAIPIGKAILRAKDKYHLANFSEITPGQIEELILSLEEYRTKNSQSTQTHCLHKGWVCQACNIQMHLVLVPPNL